MKCTRAWMLSLKSHLRLGTWNGTHHVWTRKICPDGEGDEVIQPKYSWSKRDEVEYLWVVVDSGETIVYSGNPV